FIVFENQVGDYSSPTYAYYYDRDLAQTYALNDGKKTLAPAISGNGALFAYADASDISMPIVLRERETGITTVLSRGVGGVEPDGISDFPSLSQDGRYVAFLSDASNLVSEDSNGTDDIFVYDRFADKTILASVQGKCGGIVSREDFNTGPPMISSDGKTIV